MAVNSFEVRRRPNFMLGDVDEQTIESWRRRPQIYTRDTALIIDALPGGFRHVVTGENALQVTSKYGRPRQVTVHSVTHDYFTIKNLLVTAGRPLTEQDDRLNAPVVVIGQDVKDHFFPNIDPIGRELRIGALPYQVVGVAEKQGSTFGLSLDKFVITPFSSPVRRAAGSNPDVINSIIVQAPSEVAVTVGQEAVRQALRAAHKLRPNQKDDFSLITQQSSLQFWNKIKKYLVIAGVALPMIGLVVGAIVIMNIMLVAVSERTQEIGIRKSLGARRRDILAQFLIEAATLSTAGAAFGVAAGALIAIAVATFSPIPTRVAPWSVLVSVMLGMAVGIVAGVYPASRASRLDPIAALRAET
jgi:putative ABC transport system permease protein